MEVVRARYNYQQGIQKGRGKRFVAAILAAIALIFGSGGYAVAAAVKDHALEDPVAVQFDTYQPEKVELAWPKQGQAALGTGEDGLLAVSPGQKQQPMASITKIVTALVVLERLPLNSGETGEVYTMDARDVQYFNEYVNKLGSVVPVRTGLELTQYDMLSGLLLPSANNMADSLVRRAFESETEFLSQANAFVKNIGLKDTVVADASGFSAGSVSTPSDLVQLAGIALQNDTLRQITAQKSYDFPGWGEIKNSNQLLARRPGTIGLKTGTTDEAGYCLLFAEEYSMANGEIVTITGAMLGNTSTSGLYDDVSALLNSAEAGFGEVIVVPKGTVVGEITSAWGDTSQILLSEDLKVYGWKGEPREVTVSFSPLSLPAENAATTGTIITSDAQASQRLVLGSPLDQPDYLWRLKNVF